MTRIFTILLTLTIIFTALGCTESEQVAPETTKLEESFAPNAQVYEVFGMDCPGCQGGVEKLLKKIPEVEDAKANWQKQRLVVTPKPGTEVTDEAVHDAIERANFTPGKRLQ
ncbi:zinc/cadmium/mercury/lead-transporting ATPase [Anaerohalosphaera lusitana]|uniref:Zinc/cadmium/mercury/lead-transporting ATPase n=1 Tax=Anaerohalosphaera lusitana TaxID=1936003 RepID=A0A1U9NL38_9BACT|nr:heavy metal-associated domain-containing protein [Anaerohalosphaera lusitana]AQT68448.1 zinc/cadmium/mercury/lead-transporting ATPase [Anaerohalosphaera lusitana]